MMKVFIHSLSAATLLSAALPSVLDPSVWLLPHCAPPVFYWRFCGWGRGQGGARGRGNSKDECKLLITRSGTASQAWECDRLCERSR